ncbi:hypothetical protein CO110_02535 [Candidatus Desantisbacteria bacterium CG_4_9_14_3_um_filter_40_11]|uniref:Uncharacterized protein n=3 Tax=unclassified Candidatus Desantisiibacteriota TaxID=3106372 RepID=A0A2M7NZP1_9BACT|nr:MAG: hypothetical protein COX18_05185 [Candidatus Desantisbacteria bacterium CG23_combo_of_CG06-09_8_20_14_all_40_23]PIY18840.1 MAG: hypothetical protein COZ13_08480 [Candidatus Desantisbacteria bacterium CG_4_10_14_3_um_filter_40_18]PJB30061.1 MAG: hypothetical protein CO110_02535 [Candidatus Desantisbacteria bacterium CG_4_9_14_3_um_filter_40_11]
MIATVATKRRTPTRGCPYGECVALRYNIKPKEGITHVKKYRGKWGQHPIFSSKNRVLSPFSPR